MNNRLENGQGFGFSMRVTPEHMQEAIKRTEGKNLSSKAFIAVLGSIAYKDQGKIRNPIGFGKR